jgi:MFS family permease
VKPLVNQVGLLLTGVRLTKRGFLAAMIPSFSFLSWYAVVSVFVLQHIIGSSSEAYLIANAAFNFSIVISLMVSGLFIDKFNRIHIIYVCSIVTSILSSMLLITPSTLLRLLLVFIAGIFFSMAHLAGFTYFWSLTVSWERGRTAGLIGLFSLPINYLILFMAEMFDFFAIIMIVVILGLMTLVIKLLNPENKALLTTKKEDEERHPERKTFFLYAAPWILFSLVNATLARNISTNILQSIQTSFYLLLLVLQLGAAVLGAMVGGIIADFFGRRVSLVFSLTVYGLGSALIGLTGLYEVLHIVYFTNGLNWGILWVLYIFVIWGDLANRKNCAKIYSIGLTIFYTVTGVSSLIVSQTLQIPLVISSLASCLLIFLSNIPLLIAPELLSPDFRERIKMKLYMNIVKKIRRRPSQNQG